MMRGWACDDFDILDRRRGLVPRGGVIFLGVLGIHLEATRIHVTHVATGMFMGSFTNLRHAIQWVEKIEPMANWALTSPVVDKEKLVKARWEVTGDV